MSVLVGKAAPDFKVKAVKAGKILEDYTLSQFKGQKYVVLFFYPADFTFVCPTELHELQAKLHQFEERDAQVIAASTDSEFSHVAWLEKPKKQGGIEGVTYPILADFTKTVAADYDVLLPDGKALRATFIIDKDGIVQSQIVNNLDLGRNIDETLRTLQALQFTEEHGVVCPANWTEGSETMAPDFAGLKAYFATK